MMKVAQYMADFFVANGITDMFTITGGGAMHLNDAFGHKEGLHCVYNHHEQACAIAAEGYTRLTNRLCGVCVTSGPGGTNALTGVLGGWLDSIPMFIVSGQVKRETTTWATDVPLRQLGDQEFNIVECAKTMTKYACMVTDASTIRYHMEKALYLCKNGRPGPVWLDIPLDIQAAPIDVDELKGFDPSELSEPECPIYNEALSPIILEKIKQAKRPVILVGTGVRLANAHKEFLELIEKLQIPVVTAWNAHDVLEDSSPLFCGRPGTVGTRGGNFVVQNSDLLFVLGCRLNIRQISYNYHDFAKNAYKIIVDIDKNELKKPTIKADMPVHADVQNVIKSLLDYEYTGRHHEWLLWCCEINKKYPATLSEYYKNKTPINPYAFMTEIFKAFEEGEDIICGNGSACVISFQAAIIKKGQRLFTNSGCAAMGYGFPAAIGACIAKPNKRIVCLDGDGSFQMNIQELQTVVYNNLNLKIIYLNNNGYHSIRQTQQNLFQPPLIGVNKKNGVSFPDMEKIAYAYGIPYLKIETLDEIVSKMKQVLEMEGPVLCEAILDETQNFAPKLSSKVLPDGRIVSPPIDDMYPFLDKAEYEENKKIVYD